MSDINRPRATVSASASVTIRQRPSLMLMLVRVRAAEATLELGLTEVKKRCGEAAHRLTRLGAAHIEAGEPHPDEQADPDPMAKIRASMPRPRRRSNEAPPTDRPGVNVLMTATWDVAALSAVEALMLVDRLRFEAAADAAEHPAEKSAELPAWAGPEEQLAEMVAQMTQPPAEDRSPRFLYVARVGDEQQTQAAAEAYTLARRKAERLAHAAGRRLGELSSLHGSPVGLDTRADMLMERQRCAAWLAASSYHLGEGETVTENPRSAEFTFSITANFILE